MSGGQKRLSSLSTTGADFSQSCEREFRVESAPSPYIEGAGRTHAYSAFTLVAIHEGATFSSPSTGLNGRQQALPVADGNNQVRIVRRLRGRDCADWIRAGQCPAAY